MISSSMVYSPITEHQAQSIIFAQYYARQHRETLYLPVAESVKYQRQHKLNICLTTIKIPHQNINIV